MLQLLQQPFDFQKMQESTNRIGQSQEVKSTQTDYSSKKIVVAACRA